MNKEQALRGGLPGRLPEGERLLWQGAPAAKALMRRVFHVPAIACYFFIMLVWYLTVSLTDGSPVGHALLGAARFAALAAIPVGLLAAFAWLTARTTVYTLTSRRIVIHAGIALPLTTNIPFRVIESADLKTNADGSGDVMMTLPKSERIAYLALWPHARPWHLGHAQPTLRAIDDAGGVAAILATALVEFQAGTPPSLPDRAARPTAIPVRVRGLRHTAAAA